MISQTFRPPWPVLSLFCHRVLEILSFILTLALSPWFFSYSQSGTSGCFLFQVLFLSVTFSSCPISFAFVCHIIMFPSDNLQLSDMKFGSGCTRCCLDLGLVHAAWSQLSHMKYGPRLFLFSSTTFSVFLITNESYNDVLTVIVICSSLLLRILHWQFLLSHEWFYEFSMAMLLISISFIIYFLGLVSSLVI